MIQKHLKSWRQQGIPMWIKIGNHLDKPWKKTGKVMRLNGEREAGLKREEKVPEQLAV